MNIEKLKLDKIIFVSPVDLLECCLPFNQLC
jgi:hypothetical protein